VRLGLVNRDAAKENRPMEITHWDEVTPYRRDYGHIGGAWFDLGRAAGTRDAGVRRIRIDPGKCSTPAHIEGGDEEIFYVLGGSGLSWQDGRVHEVGEGDCLVHHAAAEAHTLRAGDDGLDVLAFGTRSNRGGTYLPRAGVAFLTSSWVETGGQHPFDREAAAGEPDFPAPSERPSSIVNVEAVEAWRRERGDCGATIRDLGRAAGSIRTGLGHVTVDAGALSAPPHCHSAEEEIFVILDGEGTLQLGDEEHPVRRGNVVPRPPGTRVAHAFRGPLTLLAYGTREPNDIAYYPRSGKVSLRGVGVIGRIAPLDYWDGEE
jgi:uncharacterized cupin superfamily protein